MNSFTGMLKDVLVKEKGTPSGREGATGYYHTSDVLSDATVFIARGYNCTLNAGLACVYRTVSS
jgi:hypothetical protein